MGYWTLLKRNPRSIGFGFLQAFFSGPGQTHFISLYTPLVMGTFALSATEYGSLYSLITLMSGFTISFVGPWIDRVDVRYFSGAIGLGMILSLLLIGNENSLLVVCVGLFGLRLFGQGLCSSLSSITVARYFEEGRGKALSLSQLGFPFYEGFITPLAAYFLGFLSLQHFLLLMVSVIVLIYLPLGLFLTRGLKGFNLVKASEHELKSDATVDRSWSRREVFSSLQVYLLIPQVLMPPFALTGLFFHQALIAESKNWSLPLMASGLFFFAIGRTLNTFVTGPLVDRMTAVRLFPFYQIPLAFGFLVLALGNALWIPAFTFFLFGLTVGSGGPIKSAIWAELYGIKHLGAIKSLFATIMIFSTAASPALFGWAIDASASARPLLLTLFFISIVSSLLSLWSLKTKRQTKP